MPFPGSRARKHQIPGGGSSAKSHFSSFPVLRPPPVASESASGEFWGAFWRVPGPPFALSDRRFTPHVKKRSLGLFLGANAKDLRLQKHANRTVHPQEISDELKVA